MKHILLFLLIFTLTYNTYAYFDSTQNKDSLKNGILEKAKSNDNSYYKILLDSNSILRINEISENYFWTFNNLLPTGISLISVFISIAALVITRKKFKREHIINLFNYWEEVNEINPAEPIYVDLKNAVNALTLTAIIWNYKIIDRRIIYSSHWDAFKKLYDTLISCHKAPKGTYKTCSTYITKDIQNAYDEMSNFNK